jgi:hypothetical protein
LNGVPPESVLASQQTSAPMGKKIKTVSATVTPQNGGVRMLSGAAEGELRPEARGLEEVKRPELGRSSGV